LQELGKEYLRHIHFAQTNGRIYPQVFSEDNYLPFINVLKEIGYNERISMRSVFYKFYQGRRENAEVF
jgi:hypothetical protein